MVKNTKKEIINREIAQELIKLKGEARGINLKNDADFVLGKEGKEGLKKVEKELERLGYPIKYKDIKTFGFYPLGLRAISLLAIKKTLGWGNEKIKEMGGFSTATSLIIRIYLKFFTSVERAIEIAPKIYKEYFTVGKLTVLNYDLEKKYVVLELSKDLTLHPVFCFNVAGFFATAVGMIVGTRNAQCKEIKCPFKGDDSHQFKITWE